MPGYGREPYTLKNVGGVYSCSCPAWRNQSLPIDRRTCKHLRQYRGEAAEAARLGQPPGASAVAAPKFPAKLASPKLLLAQSWDQVRDPTGWWISEKLDGVRAYWNGRQLVSRNGNPFHAPGWFTASLPTMHLDGELWIARKAFQRTVGIVRRQDAGELWRQVTYQIFDAPALGGPFEARLEAVQRAISAQGAEHARVLQHEACLSLAHLHDKLAQIEALGGEGLMLRQPGSPYEAGRSSTLLKVKRFQDAEGRVIEHLPGSGRHQGRLGALLVELASGVRVHVGTGFTDSERESPPPIGSQITFRYQELTDGGVPRFPSFVRVRTD
jgi:DNA ligase-1